MLDTSICGNSKKIFKPRSNTSIRYSSFAVRIVEDWNSLLQDIIISSTSVLQFKTNFDKYWIIKGTKIVNSST